MIVVDTRGRTLVTERGTRLADRPATEFGDQPPVNAVLLGEQDGVAYFAVLMPAESGDQVPASRAWGPPELTDEPQWLDLRQAGATLDDMSAGLFTTAAALSPTPGPTSKPPSSRTASSVPASKTVSTCAATSSCGRPAPQRQTRFPAESRTRVPGSFASRSSTHARRGSSAKVGAGIRASSAIAAASLRPGCTVRASGPAARRRATAWPTGARSRCASGRRPCSCRSPSRRCAR